jgi:hypothetical protein
VLCCGDNTWGQCGVPLDTARVTRLTQVPGIPAGVTAVAAGLRHSLCLVLGAASQQQSCGCSTGAADTPGDAAVHSTVYGWGSNRHEQLGCREGPPEETQPLGIPLGAGQTSAACCPGNHANPKPKQRQAYWQPAPLQLLAGVQQVSLGCPTLLVCQVILEGHGCHSEHVCTLSAVASARLPVAERWSEKPPFSLAYV